MLFIKKTMKGASGPRVNVNIVILVLKSLKFYRKDIVAPWIHPGLNSWLGYRKFILGGGLRDD